MTTQEGNKILMDGKLFEQDQSGLMTEIEQESPLEFYPADEISFQPIAQKALSSTNIPWETILNTISIHEKRLLGKLSFYHQDWLARLKRQK